ncbi:NAD(P)/FAD-dependent oxidoreductase [Methanolobus vulcani]|uniref:NAD(P)/FAD-dependent oxidoreductase n=1 Tax=Methanolobus vulcani TaxID=38026 RepID=A0A7Z8P271_9EURY|nr:FAD-dependent oxidoreductase [Methanolobus vulcani]TQD25290.1 NAD(P)/FAD-dependent oxidoreductase [Methanolobus vulcani]
MKEKVLILGAGYAGSVVANILAREFRNKIAKDELEVTILDKNDININQGGFTFIPFELYTPEDITRPRKKLISPRVKAFFGADGEVTAVNLQNKEVAVKSNKKYSYDYLVIAMGCRADVNAVPGLTDDLNTFYTSMEDAFKVRDLVKNLNNGKVVVSVASMPVPCPGAPVKFTFMLDSYLRNVKKIRDDVQLTLVWPMEPIGPPEFNKFVTSQFEEKGVEVIRNFPLANVDAANKELTSKNGDKINYDTLITVPPHKAPQILIDSGLTDEKGWIGADKSTLQYRGPAGNYDNVYVLGDLGPADILKTGIGAHYQAIAVSQSLKNDIYGNGIQTPYEGETGCPLVTELETPATPGKGYIATWKYAKPPEAFSTTKMGWFLYRMYYHIHWDISVKGLF